MDEVIISALAPFGSRDLLRLRSNGLKISILTQVQKSPNSSLSTPCPLRNSSVPLVAYSGMTAPTLLLAFLYPCIVLAQDDP